jgi:alpha-glucosidase
MNILKKTFFGPVILLAAFLISCSKQADTFVSSPDGNIKVTFSLDDMGIPEYAVNFKNRAVMSNSRLGLIREDADFSANLRLDSVSAIVPITDHYIMLYGKKREVNYYAQKRIFHLSNSSGEPMDITFQVSNDGVVFNYSFVGQSNNTKMITSEITSFNFAEGTNAWIQPRAKSKTGWNHVNPSYEEHYWPNVSLEDIVPNDSGWVLPALFQNIDCWFTITESWPDRNYCGSHLQKGNGPNEMVIAFPDSTEGFTNGTVFPESKLPWTTPWRIIAMGGNPGVIVESTLGTDVAKPSVLSDISFVKPGRASWSWVLMKDASVNYEVQKQFINYAADMGWEYCLIDADWDTRIGWDKIVDLAQLAKSKNVGLLLWYNSAGDWNTVPYHPKDKLLTSESRNAEFAKLQALGIKGIKVDFFGGDGQSMMDYYQDILIDAAKFRLMVNCHGATLPRGLERTYPNLVSMESVRGLEFATFGQETADKVPRKSTILPFTRNAFDPMDFTPVCFTEYDNNIRITGNGAELAQAVIFISGIQHYAETPAGMRTVPEYVRQMMRDIPVSWDETKFVAGYPGLFVVIARRTGDTWYIAGISAEKTIRDLELELPFVTQQEGKYISEADSLRSFSEKTVKLEEGNMLKTSLWPNGGFVLKMK